MQNGGSNILVSKGDYSPSLCDLLRARGFEVVESAGGLQDLELARANHPVMAVLSSKTPDLSGLDVCRCLKNDPATTAICVLVVGNSADEDEGEVAFQIGADDYVTPPCQPRELALRIEAILRRSAASGFEPQHLESGELAMDLERHEVTIAGREVELTAIEFKLLSLFLRKVEIVLSRESLLQAIWGERVQVDSRTVDTHIRRLREKLGVAGDRISTVRGFGYRLLESAPAASIHP